MDSVLGHSIKIAASSPVIPSFSINAYPGYVVELGENDTLVAVISGGVRDLTYQWFINDSLISGATKDTFIYNNANLLSRTDSVSCLITSTKFCRIATNNWTFVTGIDVGVAPVNQPPIFSIFPNPNSGVFTVKGSAGNNEVSIEVMDMPGRVIYEQKAMPVNGKINEQVMLPVTLPYGMYMLNVRSGAGSKVFSLVVGR